jgi:hypothetical protein
MNINGWSASQYHKTTPTVRLSVWVENDGWSGQVLTSGYELIAENLRAFTTPEEAMRWAEETAKQLVSP